MTEADRQRLERLRRKWEQDAAPKPKVNCDHSDGFDLLVRINPNGSRFVFQGCRTCHKMLRPGEWVGKARLPPMTREDGEVVEDRRTQNPPCQVCGNWGTELHHWAPRAFFGQVEADHWPTGWLCRECHARWHQIIGRPAQQTLHLEEGEA